MATQKSVGNGRHLSAAGSAGSTASFCKLLVKYPKLAELETILDPHDRIDEAAGRTSGWLGERILEMSQTGSANFPLQLKIRR